MGYGMARYKHIDTSPRFLAVDLERQLIPGTFEHSLNHLLDHELDLSGVDARYRNDATGACNKTPPSSANGSPNITADAGYHSEANLKRLAGMGIDALIADNGMRKRDERFKEQGKYKALPDPLPDKTKPAKKAKRYRPQDFAYDPKQGTCICPAGKRLYQNGSNCIHNGHTAIKFQGAQRDCLPCAQRDKCLRTPEKTKTRQVCFFQGKAIDTKESYTDRMKRKMDSPEGRARYGQRFATVEPVFGNLRYNKGLDRFTLRGRKKVDAQ